METRCSRRDIGFGIAGGALILAATPGMAAAFAIKPPAAPKLTGGVKLNVRDFGATGDGATKDTLALQQVLDRCAVLGGGEVTVPPGTYLTGALKVGARTVLRLGEGATLMGSPDLTDYPVTQVRWEGKWIKGYVGLLWAMGADDVVVTGKGRLIGNTAIKGRVDKATGMRHPALIEFVACRRVRFEGLFTQQNDMWSIHPVYCEDLVFKDMTVNGNADGIDIDSCLRVRIEACDFDTADDCISLKSGRGEEGHTLARPTEEVFIANCTFRDQHWACIGIGSETSGGIRNVRVENCRCLSARTFAIYIKSRPGRGAFIENIHMSGLDVSGVGGGFLRLNFLDSGKQDEVPVGGDVGIPRVRNLSFDNIRVTDVPVLVEAVNVHPRKPVEGFVLKGISGTCRKGISMAHIRNANLRDITVTGFDGPLISAYEVTGTGLTSAAVLVPPKTPEPVPPLSVPYVLR